VVAIAPNEAGTLALGPRLRRLKMAGWPKAGAGRLSHSRSPPWLDSASLRRGPAYGGSVSRQLPVGYRRTTSEALCSNLAVHQ
jgi:hypothetical protein